MAEAQRIAEDIDANLKMYDQLRAAWKAAWQAHAAELTGLFQDIRRVSIALERCGSDASQLTEDFSTELAHDPDDPDSIETPTRLRVKRIVGAKEIDRVANDIGAVSESTPTTAGKHLEWSLAEVCDDSIPDMFGLEFESPAQGERAFRALAAELRDIEALL